MVGTCGIVLPIALTVLVRYMGFPGSAIAMVVYQASQASLLILYLVYKRPHHPMTWPGLHLWREALAYRPVMAYMRLGAGGVLANSVSFCANTSPVSLSCIHSCLFRSGGIGKL